MGRLAFTVDGEPTTGVYAESHFVHTLLSRVSEIPMNAMRAVAIFQAALWPGREFAGQQHEPSLELVRSTGVEIHHQA